MTLLNNVLGSATSVADGVAHVFTGMGSELGKLNQLTRSKQQPSTRQQPVRSRNLRSLLFMKQPPYTKQLSSTTQYPSNQPFTKKPLAEPALIGNSTTLRAHRPHLLCEAEDDRWMHEQVESLQPVAEPARWRSCKGCASLCSAHSPTCEVCEARVASLLEMEASDVSNLSMDEEEASEDEEEASEDEIESLSDDGESIPGTVDVPPPKGTQVKVLYDDDKWHLADVLAVRGTQARVCFECGTRTVVDFEVHAVRLAEYLSDGEMLLQDDEDEDDDSDREDDEADTGSEKKNDEESNEQEEQSKGSEEDNEEKKSDEEDEEDQGRKDSSFEDMGKEETDSEDSAVAVGKDAEEDSESEEVQIAGTLDEAPPVGTLVQILCDDDSWHLARVKESTGTKAMIVYSDNGEEEELDFDIDAVRLSGYVSQDEESHEKDGTQHVESKTLCEAEKAVQANTGEEELIHCKGNYEVGSGSSNRALSPGVRVELGGQSDEEF